MTLEFVPSSFPTAIILLWPFLTSHVKYCNSLLTSFHSLPLYPTLLRKGPSCFVFFFKKFFIYLAALGLSYGMWTLSCNIWDLFPDQELNLHHCGSDNRRICLQCRRPSFRKILRREWLPTPVFLAGEFHGQRSLAGYSPWGCKRVGLDWATNSN